jgi:hypothetical protein
VQELLTERNVEKEADIFQIQWVFCELAFLKGFVAHLLQVQTNALRETKREKLHTVDS